MSCRQGSCVATFQPFGVLAHHGVHDADESLVAVEEAVAPVSRYPSSKPWHMKCSESMLSMTPAIGIQIFVDIGQLGVKDGGPVTSKTALKPVAQAPRPGRKCGSCGRSGSASSHPGHKCPAPTYPAFHSRRGLHIHRVVSEDRECGDPAGACPPLAWGLAPMRRLARWAGRRRPAQRACRPR